MEEYQLITVWHQRTGFKVISYQLSLYENNEKQPRGMHENVVSGVFVIGGAV